VLSLVCGSVLCADARQLELKTRADTAKNLLIKNSFLNILRVSTANRHTPEAGGLDLKRGRDVYARHQCREKHGSVTYIRANEGESLSSRNVYCVYVSVVTCSVGLPEFPAPGHLRSGSLRSAFIQTPRPTQLNQNDYSVYPRAP
jgi:hypothetical protein